MAYKLHVATRLVLCKVECYLLKKNFQKKSVIEKNLSADDDFPEPVGEKFPQNHPLQEAAATATIFLTLRKEKKASDRTRVSSLSLSLVRTPRRNDDVELWRKKKGRRVCVKFLFLLPS